MNLLSTQTIRQQLETIATRAEHGDEPGARSAQAELYAEVVNVIAFAETKEEVEAARHFAHLAQMSSLLMRIASSRQSANVAAAPWPTPGGGRS